MTWEDFINEHDDFLCAWHSCHRDRMKGDIFCELHCHVAMWYLVWKVLSMPFLAIWYLTIGTKIKTRKKGIS